MNGLVNRVYRGAKYDTLRNHLTYIDVRNDDGYTALMLAVINRDMLILYRLLVGGADPNIATTFDPHTTALTLAVERQLSRSVRELIRYGAHFSCAGGVDALEVAVNRGYFLELIAGEDIYAGKSNGQIETALAVAYQNNMRRLMDRLLINGLPLNRSMQLNFTKNHPEFIMILAREGASVTAETLNALIEAREDIDCVDKYGETLLHKAVIEDGIEVVRLLIAAGATVDAVNRGSETALHIACLKENCLEMVKCLLESGANINSRDILDKTPLINSAYCEIRDIAQYLVANGADVTTEDVLVNTALFIAVIKDDVTLAQILVDGNANIDQIHISKKYFQVPLPIMHGKIKNVFDTHKNNEENHAYTMLMIALELTSFEIADLLIKAGSDLIRLKNRIGNTALHFAVNYGSEENLSNAIEKILKTQGSENFKHPFDVLNKLKQTPLHVTAVSKKKTHLDLLIQAGACVNLKCVKGNTPLMEALSTGWEEGAQMLLGDDADVNIRNKRDCFTDSRQILQM